MSTDLFRFEFASPLTRPQIEVLKSATGMRIGDTRNPYKDTPGKGRVAGNVQMYLGRDQHDGEWHIIAFSPDMRGVDMDAVAALRQRLMDVLPTIATEWKDVNVVGDSEVMGIRNPGKVDVEFHARGADARGVYTSSGLVVLAGSRGTAKATDTFKRNRRYLDTLRHLQEEGIVRVDRDSLVFLRNYTFPSATAAAHVLSGASIPGPLHWRLLGGKRPLRDALQAAS